MSTETNPAPAFVMFGKPIRLDLWWVALALILGLNLYDKIQGRGGDQASPIPAPAAVDQVLASGRSYAAALPLAYGDQAGPVERLELKTWAALQTALDRGTLEQRTAFREAFEAEVKRGCDAAGNITSPAIVVDALARAKKGLGGQ